MDTVQLKEHILKLERDIAGLITDFVQETEVYVESVDVDLVATQRNMATNTTEYHVAGVNVKVAL